MLPVTPFCCGRCSRFRLNAALKLSAHGFGQCELQRPWRFMSERAGCWFTPARFEARA